MRRDSALSVAQGKGQVLSRRRRGGGLTCSEGQVDDGIHMSYYGINSSPMKEGSWLD